MRSEGQLLAELIVRERPEVKEEVRRILAESGPEQGTLSAVGQSLIRAKVISPQEFLACRALVEEGARRRCPKCAQRFVALAAPRAYDHACSCGQAITIHATPTPFSSASSRRATQTGRQPRNADGSRVPTGYTSKRRKGEDEPEVPGSPTSVPERIGRYRILGHIGGGGMGLIYEAQEPETGRRVALKLLRRGASPDAELRFEREAEAIAQLSHPAVIKVHDVSRDERTGAPFFTMDLIEGRELQQARHDLSREQLLEVVATVADGLHHAHERGIVHRDVKPHNILLDAKGQAKIADFGLARDLGRSSLTEDGDLIGTPLFMSPEQLRGDPGGIDRRTDVYALGVVLYQGLTDKLPVDAGSFYELQQKMSSSDPEPPSSIADVPRELDGVVLKALAKRPEDRYPTAAALAADLRRFLAGESVEAKPMSSAARVSRRAWGWLTSPWGVVALGSLLLLGILAGFLVHVRARAAEEEALRARLDARRGMCLRVLAEARAAFDHANQAWSASSDAAAALEALAETERLAANAEAQAKDLASDAPPNVRPEARTLTGRAVRLRAAVFAAGDPEQQERARGLYQELSAAQPRDADLRLALGRLELADDRVLAAGKLFQQIVAGDDDRLDAVFWKAEATRLAGQPQFARFDYERALADRTKLHGVRPSTVLAARAQAYLAMNDLDAARADLEAAQAEDATDPRVRRLRVELLTAQGEHEAALAEVQLASRTFPKDPDVRLAAARAWAVAGVGQRARAELDAALQLLHAPRLWIARARLRELLGDPAGADADLARALTASDPTEPHHQRVLLTQARILRGRGEAALALRALAPILEAESSALRTEALLERAELLSGESAHDEATEAFGRAEAERAVRARRGQAWVALAKGDLPGALARARAALELSGDDVVALSLQAHVLALQGHTEAAAEARRRYEEASAELSGRAPGLWLDVGDPLREALSSLHHGLADGARAETAVGGQANALRARAKAHLERSVRLAPWWVPGRIALAERLARDGEDEAALAELALARSSGPPLRRGDQLRGTLLARAKKHDDAVRALDRALEGLGEQDDPASRRQRAELLLARARSLQATAKEEQALATLDRALDLDPKLLDAHELRAWLRSRGGDSDGAAEDRQRVELLRSGYKAIYSEARRRAWEISRQGQHQAAIGELAPAFALVDRARDPARMAELHYVRAYMRLRCVELRGAIVDQAAMLELAPGAFLQVYDELTTLGNQEGSMGLNLEPLLREIYADRDRQSDADPEFLAGYVAFVSLEFAGQVPEGRLRGGIRALDRYLARRPGHSSAGLLRAALLLKAGQVAEATRGVMSALERPEPPGFAHYMLCRIQTAQQDVSAALRSLERALSGGFHVYDAVARDPALAPLRGEARYQSLVKRSQGRGYLKQARRAEEMSREVPHDRRREVYGVGVQSAATGLGFLADLIRAGDVEALALAADLHLVRAKLHARGGDLPRARLHLAAALEADPRVLLDGEEMTEAARALDPLTAKSFKDVRPDVDAPLPTRLRAAVPIVLAALTGGAPSKEDLAQAARVLEGGSPRQKALLMVIRLAEGDSHAASQAATAARELEGLEGLVSYLSGRVHAALGHEGPALDALEKAKQAGLRPCHGDPTLVSVRDTQRFQALFPQVGGQPSKRWRR